MRVRALVLPLLFLLVAWPASAQPPAGVERPYRGLFGGHDSANKEKVRRLDLSFTAYGGYDDNILASGQAGTIGHQTSIDPRFQASGRLGGAQTELVYNRRTSTSWIDISAGSAYRYYPTRDRFSGLNSWADAAFWVRFNERTSLHATESVYYSPYYSLAPFESLGEAGTELEAFFLNQEYALLEDPAIIYGSTAEVSRRLTQRGSLSFDYSFRYVDFRDEVKPLRNGAAGGRYTYAVTKNAKLKLGYHYNRAEYGVLPVLRRVTEVHNIDAGVDYSRALSISRKTTFGFQTGSAAYKGVRGADGAAADERMHYAVTGSAYLRRAMGRTWAGQVEYQRAMRFIEGFSTPFFVDGVSGQLKGFLGRRTNLSTTAAYAFGSVGAVGSRNYRTFSANAHAQVALARYMAFYADYVFYHYNFDSTVVLPNGMGRGVDRNGVRVGINLWVPLLR